MTIQRMVELLKIEHECMLRKSHDTCDSNCGACDLVQDDGELHEMYTDVIGMVEGMLPVEPEFKMDKEGSWWYECGNCGNPIDREEDYRCYACERKVKWNDKQ